MTLPWSGAEQLRKRHSSGRDPMRWTGLLNPRTSKRLCQPSHKASSILLWYMTMRTKQVDFSAFSCTYTTINYHCTTVTTPTTLAIMFIQEFDAVNESKQNHTRKPQIAHSFSLGCWTRLVVLGPMSVLLLFCLCVYQTHLSNIATVADSIAIKSSSWHTHIRLWLKD